MGPGRNVRRDRGRPVTSIPCPPNPEAGGLDYSPANRRKILGSLRRAAEIYDTPATAILADPELFTRRWGRGGVTTYPIAHFKSTSQFSDWRTNVRGAFAQATGAKAAGRARRAALDGRTEILAGFDTNAGSISHGDLFNKPQRPGRRSSGS